MPVPQFDPSQPFTAATAAPAFDPDQPFTTADALPIPRDRRGLPLVTSATSDAPPTDLERMAHPQTLVDFARILSLPVDSVRRAMAMALTVAAARPTAGAALSATGRAVEKAGVAAERPAELATAYEMVTSPKKAVLTMAAPPALKMVGRGLQRAGAAVTGAPIVAEAVPVAETAAPAVDEFTAARAAKSAAANALPDQKALNEAALAARRQAYQARQAAAAGAPEAIVPASGKMRFTADEMKAFAALRKKGLSLADAEAAVKAMRTLAKDLPTTAEAQAAIAARGYKR